MREAILNELLQCECAKNVRVLIAVESGSRCWGFASEDSDYDVRFVYARPQVDYLRLEGVRDTIEWRLDEELDIAGWDIGKFLKLLRSSNPTAFEWLGSPIVYREEERFREVRELAPRCFNPVAHAHHYLGMASRHSVRHIKSGRITLKRYLYAIRALLAAQWAIERQSPVPMAFSELCDAQLDKNLRPLIERLVEVKTQGLEGDRQEAIPELDEWICCMETGLKERICGLTVPNKVAWDDLNGVFLNQIAYHEE
ncbi:MAG: nucleotidyltransferase domain-containing protein [Atopobiaceae bacterium]|nr:nucleotidyltransferase domain-containing protein [Atopobiaceae bacterium]